MNKKGDISPIFKYIFVMLVGGIILFFFIKFGLNMTKTSEEVTSAKISNILDDSLTAFGVSQNSNTYLPEGGWPKDIKVIIDCGAITSDNFKYPVKSQKIIFSPKTLNGKTIDVWTKVWKWPYSVDNFYYMSNKKTKIYFVGDSGDLLDESSPDRIPKRFNVEAIKNTNDNFAETQAKSYDLVKFVFFNMDPNIDESNKIKTVKIVTDDFETGYAEFSDGNGIFLGKEMLYGAIFSDNYEEYSCMYSRAMQRLKILTESYYEKTNVLYLKNPECNYDPMKNNFMENINLIDSDSANKDSYVEIKNNLEEVNKELYGDLNCKVVF